MTLLAILRKFFSALLTPTNPDEEYLAGATDVADVERRIQELERRRGFQGFNARFG